MAVTESRVINGVTRATWDDAAETYTEFAADGTTVTSTRPYTAVELAIKADRVARATAGTNSTAMRTQALAAVNTLIADRAALATATTANNATVTAIAAALRRTDRYLIETMRLVSGLLDTTDSGPA